MNVTFRESEPFYGEKTYLSSLFSSLDSNITTSDDQEEESEDSTMRGGDDQPRRMEAVIGSIPRSIDEPNSTIAYEAS